MRLHLALMCVSVGWLLVGYLSAQPNVGTPQPNSGFVLARGPVDAALHEANEGFFNVGKFSISVPPNGIPADILRQHQGVEVEIVIRKIDPRRQERLER
jgi:hypothetical protein